MKAVIFNSNNALVLEVTSAKTEENGNTIEIDTNCAKINTSINNTLIINGNEEIVNNIVESLVGEEGTITYYDPYKNIKDTKVKRKGKVKTLENTYLNK